MYELLQITSDYATIAIFVAAVLDIFFLTGYFLYGATTMATILMFYSGGALSVPEIILYALFGTLTGNTLNYFAGRKFADTALTSKTLQSAAAEKARVFLRTRGLFLFILIGRFVTFLRPVYAVVLGSLSITYRRFILYESLIAFLWVTVWLWIMITGFDLTLWIVDQLR